MTFKNKPTKQTNKIRFSPKVIDVLIYKRSAESFFYIQIKCKSNILFIKMLVMISFFFVRCLLTFIHNKGLLSQLN